MNDTKYDALQEIGRNALSSIREMVAALECDYERLEELRDERDAFEIENPCAPDETVNATDESCAAWGAENPDEAEELKDLEAAAGECKDADEARERIMDDPLSLRVFGERVDGEWQADSFELLLSTGGPAVRIVGDLDDNLEPMGTLRLEVQDWGTPWTDYYEPGISETLEAYCRCFCFET